jgi:D-psicose/D-tagatose/L-ribulose 3-epimerase
MNLLLWTDEPTDPGFDPLYERLAGLGFDGLELPIMGPAPDPAAFGKVGDRIAALGMERTCIAVCSPDADPISPDASVRTAAVAALKNAVDCTEAAGSRLLAGPLYAAIGVFSGGGPTSDEWKRSVEVLQTVAEYAAKREISLSFEFLNRFEIYLLNCAADTARYVDDIGAPNVGVHYDTFHAHIEEKDAAAAIRTGGERVNHVHISENDRGTPGVGQVRWAESFDALREIGYDGWLTIEAFGALLPSLAAATKIWRPMFESEEQLARDGLAFMKGEWEKQTG